jgi:hypothetical protein
MGYILEATAVELRKVTDALGSKDRRLLSALVKAFGDDFDQFDEMAADYLDEDEDGEPLTMQAALTQMVMGEEYNDGLGFMYGYALEFICNHFGEPLPNGGWSGMPSSTKWADTVDQALKAAGVPGKVFGVSRHLMNRGAPVEIPSIDDFPAIGYLKLAEIEAVRQALGRPTVAAIKDREVLEAIREIQGWLQTCADSSRDLICFCA